MVIGILNLKLRLPGNDSLKGKRMILKSLKDRLRNTFNISVAEVGDQDHWTLSEFALATVGTDRQRVQSVISKALGFIESDRNVQIIDQSTEIL
jgi:uncharacterized protein YlxP (DUF503 family)